jgi:hypothetical protein
MSLGIRTLSDILVSPNDRAEGFSKSFADIGPIKGNTRKSFSFLRQFFGHYSIDGRSFSHYGTAHLSKEEYRAT